MIFNLLDIKLPGIPCVYKITNAVNKSVYIGSTKCLKTRIFAHKNKLSKNKHPSARMQVDFNVSNSDLSVEILHVVESRIERLEIEQYYMDYLKPLYNTQMFSDVSSWLKYERNSFSRVQIEQIDTSGQVICIWDSLKSAAAFLKLFPPQLITRINRNDLEQGYYWKRVKRN